MARGSVSSYQFLETGCVSSLHSTVYWVCILIDMTNIPCPYFSEALKVVLGDHTYDLKLKVCLRILLEAYKSIVKLLSQMIETDYICIQMHCTKWSKNLVYYMFSRTYIIKNHNIYTVYSCV